LGAGAGFEPAEAEAQGAVNQRGCSIKAGGCAQLSAQVLDAYLHDLASVAAAWPKLKPELRAAILAIVASADDIVR